MTANLPVRRSARVILLDGAANTLLLRYVDDSYYVDPNDPDLVDYWVTPGGGVEGDESLEQAASRELFEETGFADIAMRGPVLRRRYELLIDGVHTACIEHLFIARHHEVEPAFDISRQHADELELLRDVRWWSRDTLAATSDVILPTCLAQTIEGWLNGSLGPTPRDVA
ncbi:MAG: NUDIX domain-containing protein [Pseudomonadota bacterium]